MSHPKIATCDCIQAKLPVELKNTPAIYYRSIESDRMRKKKQIMRKFSEKKCGTICRLYNRQIVKFGKFERLSHTVEISVYMRKFQQYGKAFRTYRTRETKSTSKSYPQFKLFNRMHIIFANFDICLTFTWHFLTSISSFTQFFCSTSAHFTCRHRCCVRERPQLSNQVFS